MIYNTVLVYLDIQAPAAPALAFARQLADRFESDLIALAAAEPPLHLPSEMDLAGSTNAMRAGIEKIEGRLLELKSVFDDVAGNHGRTSWRQAVGDPTRHEGGVLAGGRLLLRSGSRPGAHNEADGHEDHDWMPQPSHRFPPTLLLVTDRLRSLAARVRPFGTG